MDRYVALLRGINVGGKNLIKMPEVKACFERNGFTDVMTYIQSGNVLFRVDAVPAAELTRRIERMLAKDFDYEPTVVVRSRRQMRKIVADAPTGFGSDPASFLYDVCFIKPPTTARAAAKGIPTREGVDALAVGPGAIYFSRLKSRATQSQLNRVASLPVYKAMTIRNWNTTTKLVAMMDATA